MQRGRVLSMIETNIARKTYSPISFLKPWRGCCCQNVFTIWRPLKWCWVTCLLSESGYTSLILQNWLIMQNFRFNQKTENTTTSQHGSELKFFSSKKKLFRFAVICFFFLSLFVCLTNANILPGVYLLTWNPFYSRAPVKVSKRLLINLWLCSHYTG